jgi:hypothetical protein
MSLNVNQVIGTKPQLVAGLVEGTTDKYEIMRVGSDGGVSQSGSGTREYNMAGITRQAVGATSARVALPTLGTSRELYVMATTRCFFRSGDSSIAAAAGTSHPLAADERFHLRIPAGHTHIAYIRDTADGNISIVPVA